mgnify:CR=1 FL=1
MPTPPIVTLGDLSNDDQRIASLAGLDGVQKLLERADKETERLTDNFNIPDDDKTLANKVREWLVRKRYTNRLRAMMQESAIRAAEEKTYGNSRSTN